MEPSEELLRLREQYRELVEHISIGVYRTTPGPQGEFLMANQAFLHMTGFDSLEELQQITVSDLYENPRNRQWFSELVIETGRVTGLELSWKRRDGSPMWVSVTAQLVREGDEVFFNCTCEDISRRKLAEREKQRRAEEIRAFYALSLDLTASRDLPTLLQTIVEQAVKLLWGSAGSLSLCDPAREEVRPAAWVTSPAVETVPSMYKYGEGTIGICAQTGRPLILTQSENWGGRLAHLSISPYYAVICAPLLFKDEVKGVLQVLAEEKNRRFTDSDLELLTLFANQAAIAIENARLLEAERQRRQEAETLSQATAVLNASFDLEHVLESILTQMERVVPYDSASIFIRNQEHLRLAGGRRLPCTGLIDHEFPVDVLSQEAWSTGRAVILEDAQQEGRYQAWGEADRVRSWMGVPLIVRGEAIGLVTLDHYQPGIYGQQQAALAEAFANQAAIAIENARLFEAERKAREQADALRNAAQMVSTSLSLDEVLDAVLEGLGRVLNIDSGGVLLVEGNRLAIKVGKGYQNFCDPKYIPTLSLELDSEYAAAEVLKTGQPLVLTDAQNDRRWKAQEIGAHVQSWLGVPLQAREKTIGLLSLDRVTLDGFTPEEVALAQTFAAHVSAAIDNARLYEAAERRAAELEAIHRASISLTSSLELRQVLDSILRSVMDIVPEMQDSIIYLYSPENGGVLQFGSALSARGQMDGSWQQPRREGLTYTVAHSGQTVVVPDIRRHPLYLNAPNDWTGSIVGIPLKIGERVVGVMNIAYHAPRHFAPEELRRIRLLGDQAAIAIENARLFEAAATERRHLSLLYQVGQELTASLDPDYIMSRALTLACQALSGMMGRAFVLVPGEERLRLTAMYGWPDYSLEEVDRTLNLTPSRGLSGWVFKHRQAVVIPDTHKEKRWIKNLGLMDNARSAVSAPVMAGDRALGVFTLMHPSPGIFTDEHLHLLQAICQQVGLALSNASRYQEINRRLAEKTLIHDLAQTFNQRLEVCILLEEVVKGLAREFGYPQVRIFLVEGDELVLKACHGPVPERERFSLSEGVIGRVARTGKSVFLPDVTQDSDYEACIPETRAELAVPIYRGGLVVGVINVETDLPFDLSIQDLDLLQVLGVQISIALENAVLFERARESLLELERALEHLPVGVLLLDREHRLLASNPIARSILQALSVDLSQGYLHQIGPFFITELTARHADPSPLQLTLKGKSPRYFEALARPVGEEFQRWVLTLREVTEERNSQIRIQMQDRLATVGQLAAGIAHDFNNILAAIQVYTDLLHYDVGLAALSHERLGIIQEQVQRASSLIRQILDFSRRSVMEQSRMDLLPFLKEFVKMLGRVMPESILIELGTPPEPVVVNADPTRLQQVLMNLALNARDAMPGGGRLFFELSRFSLQPEEPAPLALLPPGDWITLTVKDEGVGIPEENLPHIYEPFFTTKVVGEGTGLGLAQVYGIIKQHDGFIDASSQPGEGTAFTLYLPALEGPGERESVPQVFESLDGVGKEVLVVEDDPATCDALEALLETHNYRVMTAENGLDALKIYEDKQLSNGVPPVSLVISDIVMPKMGGLALYEALRQRWPEVKMLFITGHPLNSESQVLLEEGRVSWLQKPFSVQQFISSVKKLAPGE